MSGRGSPDSDSAPNLRIRVDSSSSASASAAQLPANLNLPRPSNSRASISMSIAPPRFHGESPVPEDETESDSPVDHSALNIQISNPEPEPEPELEPPRARFSQAVPGFASMSNSSSAPVASKPIAVKAQPAKQSDDEDDDDEGADDSDSDTGAANGSVVVLLDPPIPSSPGPTGEDWDDVSDVDSDDDEELFGYAAPKPAIAPALLAPSPQPGKRASIFGYQMAVKAEPANAKAPLSRVSMMLPTIAGVPRGPSGLLAPGLAHARRSLFVGVPTGSAPAARSARQASVFQAFSPSLQNSPAVLAALKAKTASLIVPNVSSCQSPFVCVGCRSAFSES
jgi:hypothetical protein